jgi:hypothetical protein
MGSELLSSRGWEEEEEEAGSSVTEARHGNRGWGWLHRSGEGKERTGQDTEVPVHGSGSMVICTNPDPFINKPTLKKYLDFCV